VYNKGAEVIRMLHTLLGADGFRRGMDLYFERHDGQAVTCDEFRAAMADANGVDLEQFGRWYAQAGTPQVEAAGSWDEQTKTYALTLRQRPPVQADPSQYQAMHIPVAVGLIDPEGRDVPLHPTQLVIVRNTTAVLELREPEQTFSFTGIEGPVVPSVLRNFSAPVKLAVERTIDELSFLMGHDADPFSRWDAGQSLAQALLLGVAEDAAAGRALQLDTRFVEAFGRVLGDAELDGSLKALALRLPDERLLGQQQDVVNPESLHAARSFARRTLGEAHGAALRATYAAHRAPGGYRIDRTAIDGRRIKNVALGYWVATATEEAIALAQDQFEQADNMTDAEAALTMLAGVEHPARERSVDAFYRKWKHDPLVLDKWFSVQAASPCQSTLGRVVALAEHPDFNLRNPNRVRSLLGVFSIRNQVRFHSADGAGYTFLTDKLLEIDAINPQIAARLVGAFSQWRRFDASRRDKMRTELGRMVGHRGLSRDVYELASKYLVED
jgi:aminopeptidase N